MTAYAKRLSDVRFRLIDVAIGYTHGDIFWFIYRVTAAVKAGGIYEESLTEVRYGVFDDQPLDFFVLADFLAINQTEQRERVYE